MIKVLITFIMLFSISTFADDNSYQYDHRSSGGGLNINERMENSAIFTSPGVNSEQSFDQHRNGLGAPRAGYRVGIIPYKDTGFCSIPDSGEDATTFFKCMLKKGKKVGIGLKVICEQTGDINDLSTLGNYGFQWETKLENGRARTNINGEITLVLAVNSANNVIELKSKRLNKVIDLAHGPYEILLSQKECNPTL